MSRQFLNGIQINPLSFVDEGVTECISMLKSRFEINAIFVCTVSWLALKVGRSISFDIDGWPDHGVSSPIDLKGGAYFRPNPVFYSQTNIKDFYTQDEMFQNNDILHEIISECKKLKISVYVELMEPFFKYEGHGSIQTINLPNIVNLLEKDLIGRTGDEPSTFNSNYRNWIKAIIEDQCKSYDIDGVMWCNERCSPLDQLVQGKYPTDFSDDFVQFARSRNLDVENIKKAFHDIISTIRDNKNNLSVIQFLRTLLYNPEVLLWEKLWLENNKNLDKELYGIVKWINKDLEFGLNVWNRNHFSPIRKAQWPWHETLDYSDWVKPITYQHQAGSIYAKEINHWSKNVLEEPSDKLIDGFDRLLSLGSNDWSELVSTSLDTNHYVFSQCKDAVDGVAGRIPVYMGIGVDAPSHNANQAKCTYDMVYQSVIKSVEAGALGLIYSPNYSFMNLKNLDASVHALRDLKVI